MFVHHAIQIAVCAEDVAQLASEQVLSGHASHQPRHKIVVNVSNRHLDMSSRDATKRLLQLRWSGPEAIGSMIMSKLQREAGEARVSFAASLRICRSFTPCCGSAVESHHRLQMCTAAPLPMHHADAAQRFWCSVGHQHGRLLLVTTRNVDRVQSGWLHSQSGQQTVYMRRLKAMQAVLKRCAGLGPPI